MLHKYDLQDQSKYVGSGVYLGGMQAAMDKICNVADGAHPRDFKFFYGNLG